MSRSGAIFALLACVFGAWLVSSGVELRRAAEPAGLVAGQGLMVGVEGPGAAEVRGRPLTQASSSVRRVGGLRRSLGVGLLGFALVALALRPSTRAGAVRWPRVAWCVPGLLGLIEIITRAGASVPTAALAQEGLVDGLLLIGLSVVLLVSWR